jgi:acyl-CoA synthetase (NDP forming)
VDVAIIAVSAPYVLAIVEECGLKGIPYVVLLSSGFADTASAEGIQRQEEILSCARRHGIHLLGTNSVGFISMAENAYAGFGAFFEYEFKPGQIGFVTQSGGVGGSLLTIIDEEHLNFRYFIHTGNAAETDIENVLDAFIDDERTRILLAYIEGLDNKSNFAQVADRALQAGKPLIVWKAGKASTSGNAVVSHTGRLAGDIDRYRAVFARHGVIEIDDSLDLVDVLRLVEVDCIPKGSRVGVVSVSGGAGVIAADCLAVARNLELATFDTEVQSQISTQLPDFANSSNPIDITAQIFNEPDLFEKVVAVLSRQSQVDVVLACIASVHGEIGAQIAKAIVETHQQVDIPIVVVWASRSELNEEAFGLLDEERIARFRSPERALRALDRIMVVAQARERYTGSQEITKVPSKEVLPLASWKQLTEYEVLEVLRSYGVSVPRQRMIQNGIAATQAQSELGLSVMKLQSPEIAHKAKIGAVKLGISDSASALKAFSELSNIGLEQKSAEIRGIMMQEMMKVGVEVICGYVHDSVLGDFLLCGAGGSDVESKGGMQLITMPASYAELVEGVSSAQISSALADIPRGLEQVVNVLIALQDIVTDNPNQVGELEINPLIVNAEGAFAVDALAVPREK